MGDLVSRLIVAVIPTMLIPTHIEMWIRGFFTTTAKLTFFSQPKYCLENVVAQFIVLPLLSLRGCRGYRNNPVDRYWIATQLSGVRNDQWKTT